MKKVIFTLIAAMTLHIGYSASDISELHDPKAKKILTSQIYNMLGDNTIPDAIRGSKAEVRIAVDTGNYLRILSIETENEDLRSFIKSSIDFQKITKGTYQKGVVYRIPIEVRT